MNRSRPTVLVVEDDENDMFFLRRALEATGVEIDLQVACDGRRALDFLLEQGEGAAGSRREMPDLVLLDLKVPRLSGLEVLRQIRADARLRKLVVVILTSSALESDVIQAYELGANSFLVKPSRLEEQRVLAQQIVSYWLACNLAPPANPARDGA